MITILNCFPPDCIFQDKVMENKMRMLPKAQTLRWNQKTSLKKSEERQDCLILSLSCSEKEIVWGTFHY